MDRPTTSTDTPVYHGTGKIRSCVYTWNRLKRKDTRLWAISLRLRWSLFGVLAAIVGVAIALMLARMAYKDEKTNT